MGLFLLCSCKGQRFYWESKFRVQSQNGLVRDDLIKKFALTDNLSTWHPVFGKFCRALPSTRAHLFVCWKEDEVRVVSSYSGSLKGDEPVRAKKRTIEKYLVNISKQDGHVEHRQIMEYIRKNYRVRNEEERLLTYGRGSIIIKSELSGESY